MEQKRFDGHRLRRKGIYILPSLFTTGSLFAGFYAIVQSMSGNFDYSAIAILAAMLLDALDGRVARLTHTESEFGAQYDSIVDMVSFGLAPALIMYAWALSGMDKLGWLGAFLYAAGAGLRLARFNVQSAAPTSDKRYFRGLPSPAAAALVIGFIWVMHTSGIPGREISILALAVTVMAGVLMVSNIRFRSFKDLDLRGRMPYVAVLSVPMVFVLVFIEPPLVLFTVFLTYAISGPVGSVLKFLRRGAVRGTSTDTVRRG